MVTSILILIAVLIGIPVMGVVIWNLLKLFWAIVSDVGGLVYAFLVVGAVLFFAAML